MRISTANAYAASRDVLMQRQLDLNNQQQQLSTNKRVNRASDDPSAAARAERALGAEARADASQRAVDASQTTMTLTESAMGDAVELLQRARETLVAAGDGSYGDAERAGLASQLTALRSQLLSVANRADGGGVFLFGGQGASQPPFIDTAGGVQSVGIAGQTQVASGEALPLTVDGDAAWMQARRGNGVFTTDAAKVDGAGVPRVNSGGGWVDGGRVVDPTALTDSPYRIEFSVVGGATSYNVIDQSDGSTTQSGSFKPGQALQFAGVAVTVSGQPAAGDAFVVTPLAALPKAGRSISVFETLQKAIDDLATPLRSAAQIAQSNSNNLIGLDAVLGRMQSARSQVGDTLNRIDGVTGRLDAQRLASQTEVSNATGLDMVAAISSFQNQQTGYDAALKSYAMVQKLSLFTYLSA